MAFIGAATEQCLADLETRVAALAMSEEQKIAIDVVAGTGTAAAFMDMAPNAVAIVTGLWVLIRIWETETVKRLTGRD